MQPGALLASLANAVSPRSRRRLASCGRPLAALAVLVTGATLFSSAAALLGTRQPVAVFHAAAELARDGTGAPARHALPVHVPSAMQSSAFDDMLASLKEGAFGIAFAPPASAAMANASAGDALEALSPSVLVDRTMPPLRIDIMGLDPVPLTAMAARRAPPP